MRAWILGLVVATTASCDSGSPGSGAPPGTATAAMSAPAPSGVMRLIDVRRVAGGPDRFLVTPRWSPDGGHLLASGWRGVGLWVLDPDGGVIVAVDPEQRGPAYWSPDGATVAYAVRDASDAWSLHDLAGGAARMAARPAFVPASAPAGDVPAEVEILFDRDGRRVTWEEYRGRIEAWTGGERRVLEAWDAAGPRASPDGTRVAWWTGPLLDPTLRIADTDGRELYSGSGAHAAWLPDGERLVFAVPRAGPAADGAERVAASELLLLDLRDGATTALTATPGVVELQPAVGPDGVRIAFADWASGEILVGRLAGAARGAP